MRHKKSCLNSIYLFLLGGALYLLIELCWRRRTHWTMFFVGGACFRLIGKIFSKLAHCGLILRCALSAFAITTVEFFSGCIFNIRFKMRVWDYTNMPLNIKGQVCLLYSFLWGLLSIPAGYLHTVCERKLTRRN